MQATRTVASLDEGSIRRRLVKVLERTSREEWQAGTFWYARAHHEAVQLAEAVGQPFEVVVGVIAAISPKMPWVRNVDYAGRFLSTGHAPTLPRSLKQAGRIVNGQRPEVVLTGPKTGAFNECILRAGATDAVTVDRHALDAALGFRGTEASRKVLDRSGVYELMARCYRYAGAWYGVTGAQAQAIVWVAR